VLLQRARVLRCCGLRAVYTHSPKYDVCSEGGDGGVGRGLGMPADGEEDKDDPSSKWSVHVAKAGIEFRRHMESPSLPAPPNLLDTLLALGEYTTIVDVIYNHYDRFGKYLAGLHRA
jgi:hypothetical protein